jgi:hypothetical protein
VTKTTLAALALAAPLAALGQYDPQSAPPSSEWGAEPAPAPSQWGAPTTPQAPPAAPAPMRRRDHVRGAWYIGFGMGGGGGTATSSFTVPRTNDFSDYVGPDPTQLAMNFQVGATISPSLLLGADIQALAALSSDPVYGDSQFQLNSYDVAVTWFPWETGFFVKGGVGLSALAWSIDGAGSDTYRGVNVMGGLGYALWIGQTFNLTLNLDATAAKLDGDFESARMTNVYLGFMWY